MHDVSFLIQLEKELLRNKSLRKWVNKYTRGLPIYIRNFVNFSECKVERNLAQQNDVLLQKLVDLLPDAILIT